jgi:signal transduction histidine kinase/CheY-like chemotaxis protein
MYHIFLLHVVFKNHMKNLNKLLNTITKNGTSHLQNKSSALKISYMNVIWLCTYLTFCIYSLLVFLLHITSVISVFGLYALAIHAGFLLSFFLTRYKLSGIARHIFIIVTYAQLAVLDHFSGQNSYIILYFFAFLPTAFNIFSIRKETVFVIIYTAIPLIYALVSHLYTHTYFNTPVWVSKNVMYLQPVNFFIAFVMFVLFAGYMLINSGIKQSKLISISNSLQTTLENSGGAIWTIDKDFNLLVTNKYYTDSIEREFGVTDLAPGVNIRTHIFWNQLPVNLQQQYYKVLSGMEVYEEITLNSKYYEIKGVPYNDKNGNIAGATFGSRDITLKKHAEQSLLNAKKEAEKANAAKAIFVNNVSHELRTPLNGIIGITNLLMNEEQLTHQQDNLKTLKELSYQTLQLVNNILDFGEIEAGKATPEYSLFNLQAFVQKLNNDFTAAAQTKKIEFTPQTKGHINIDVKADEKRLKQVISIMLDNAIKFTLKGSVKFMVDVQPADNGYLVNFNVNDTGIGIQKENLHKIFDSFSQAEQNTTRRFGGTGLGLSIANKILKLMNSKMHVESEFGAGTTFWFTVFVAAGSNKSKKDITPPSSLLNTIQQPLKILLAEDNKVNQMVATRILEKWKYNVTLAHNGKEAVEHAQKEIFDIVLMDLNMPVMDGYEAAFKIKKLLPHLPVIALTASSFDEVSKYLDEVGFNGFVQKPFVPEDLLQKINSLVK